MCGEKIILRKYAPGCAGSPPRVRGKAPMPGAQDAGRRITPACAGKSSSGSSAYCVHRDHPRVCGEKCFKTFFEHKHVRITPACAGKRYIFQPRAEQGEDHPRVCGEK